MYKEWFYIKDKVGNNAFSYDKRKNKKLYVPNIIESSINEIELKDDFDKIAFEDFWFDWKISTNYGLKNFYKIKWKWKEIVLVDNHNHVFYFWYEARKKWIIGDNNILVHIDEHADTRDPEEYLLKPDSFDLEKIFEFTNYKLNVWNYIIPAQREWIVWEVIQIRNQSNLDDYLKRISPINWDPRYSTLKNNCWDTHFWCPEESVILNLDLDFFQRDLDYIDYRLKKKVILDAASRAKVITVSTSPFFIDQKYAIKVFKDIFFDK